ncbi:MAG: DUF4261 domain-containing protein [Bacteroidota bacterium]
MKLFDIFKKKEKNDEPVNNPSELLAVKLFFVEEPKIDDDKIERSLKKRFKNIGFPDVDDLKNNARQYFFKDYEVEFKEGKMPVQGTIFIPDNEGIEIEELETSFHQSWNWREAESVIRTCKFEILLTDMMSRNLDYKLRLEFFQKFVASIVEVMNPKAIWISNGEKLMNREDYLDCFGRSEYQNLNGFMNVRLFNIQESNGEMIMDTLGLNSLGLPDFEIKFREFDPSIIAGLLFNYGSYIYDEGVVIENGNTIQGIEENQKWKCYFKESLIEPKRIIIEIENGG